MSYTNKPFEELDVLDNFLMNAIATDENVGETFCRKVLSVLLQRNVGKVKVVAQYNPACPEPQVPWHTDGRKGGGIRRRR